MKLLTAALMVIVPALAFAAETGEEPMEKAEVWQVLLFLVLFLVFIAGTVWLMVRAKNKPPSEGEKF